MEDPDLSEIVGLKRANIPVQGEITSTNVLLGKEGINGIKTGTTEQAGGCYLVSSTRLMPDGTQKTLIAAILGAPNKPKAMADAIPLLQSLEQNYIQSEIVQKNRKVGSYDVPWQGKVDAVSRSTLSAYGWAGTKYQAEVKLNDIKIPADKKQKVGSIKVGSQVNGDAELADSIDAPSLMWKLKRAARF
jgi:D-alanyl-D-alanine carboxypeptidase (penicillin-binding protein 5/6)